MAVTLSGAITDAVKGFFQPVADVIEHLTVSGDEKAQLQLAALQGQLAAAQWVAQYQSQLLDSQARIIAAEATGGSWLQRNWRPITMITFLVLVVCDSFGLLKQPLAPQMWTLLQIGLGGYVVGRSVEKTGVPIANAVIAAVRGK